MGNTRAAVLATAVIAAANIWIGAGLATAAPTNRAAPAAPRALFGFSVLNGVYCTGRSDCWAVGARYNGQGVVNQFLHWNGTTWRDEPVPNPGGSAPGADSSGAAVRCVTARDCWAVGNSSTNGGSMRNEVLHWNGRAWSLVSVPQPAGTGPTSNNELSDVTCISSRNCWAAGYFGKVHSSTLNQVLHWNGKSWSRLRVPEPAGTAKTSVNELGSVRCPTASRCLAVGNGITGPASINQALTWTGRSWSRQQIPSPYGGPGGARHVLTGLGCGGPAACMAVGNLEFASKTLNQALRWNGRTWSRSFPAQPGGSGPGADNVLTWITCTSDHNCWAVGNYSTGGTGSFQRNQVQHWNGQHWILVRAPSLATAAGDANYLSSVRCTDAANCWAVGARQHGTVTNDEFLHWNGKKWSIWPPAMPSASH